MADRKNIKPIVHKHFKNEVDKEFIDSEDIGMPYLNKTTNLSPFRKDGALQQFGGLSLATLNGTNLDVAHLPNPGSGFTLIDFYSFSVDRDSTEVTILVFENGSSGEIKLYINPYFNPVSTFSNYNANKTADTWIYEWTELTEKYINTTDNAYTKTGTNTFQTAANLNATNDYFNGYFVVNLNLDNTDSTKYNFITDYATGTPPTFTTLMSMATWTNGHIIRIYKFPILHFYNAELPDSSGDLLDYANVGTTFKGKPTQFIYHQGQLRMPCGKDKRPLVLDMIYKRSYFTDAGANAISYDGFWLDFQQPIQVLYKSVVTSSDTLFDANGHTSSNFFLGTILSQINVSTTNPFHLPFVCTVILDSRNEVIIGQGFMYANKAETTNSMQVHFNSWFSRKITHLLKYHKVGNATINNGGIEDTSTIYPYFSWDTSIDINNISSNKLTSIESAKLSNNGEMADHFILDYSFNASAGYWNTYYGRLEITSWTTSPTGLKFIANTNRFIDEDITMNYTRGCFNGETNGRLFILGCKNVVEKKLFETDDNVLYNILAAGVSSYDCFNQSNSLNIFSGDKDKLTDVKSYEGYLSAIKKLDVFGIDINTDDDLRYRVVKTQIGRGSSYAESICETPHGIVMPVEDSVYLINPRGSRVLLRPDNGRLNFYKTYFASQNISSVYYAAFDELFLVQVGAAATVNNYIMVYNFQRDAWTSIVYNSVITSNGVAFKKARTNSNKEVLFANVLDNTNYNILKFAEIVSPQGATYIDVNGNTEDLVWICETPTLPYGDKILEILLEAFTMHYDINAGTTNKMRLTIKRNGTTNEVAYLLGTSTTETINQTFTQMLSTLQSTDQVQIELTNLNASGAVQAFTTFNLNSFIIWASFANRQLSQTP